ncbi:MAG: transaldolase [Acidimicrobiia bacterium]
MTRLQELHTAHGQSPWLDNLTRDYFRNGKLENLIGEGIRGVTANPTTFAHAITGTDAYDTQLAALLSADPTIEAAYWQLVIDDTEDALNLFRPVHQASDCTDGFVSLEIAPELAADTVATINSVRDVQRWIDRPNLMVKIPATDAGIPAIQAMTAEGHNINITLIFSLGRYEQVIEAYLTGLESLLKSGGDISQVHSVASFFVSRVDTEVDRRLEAVGTDQALSLRGLAAIAQAKLAYQLFRTRFASERWERLRAVGARPQRPLWASTSTKSPNYPDTMYVDELIGPDTVTTLTETTIAAFNDHGTLTQTIDQYPDRAARSLHQIAELGIDMHEVTAVLERQGIERFRTDQMTAFDALHHKASAIAVH